MLEASAAGSLLRQERSHMSRILLIDDSQDVCAIVSQALEGEHAVESVSNWQECGSLLIEKSFDLVLIDVRLGGASGDEIALALKESGFAGKVVLFSGLDEERLEALATLSGACAYITKPCPPGRLRDRIREILAG